MEYRKIKCPKCGKTITVDPYEFCCPLCGEFIKEIDNATVLGNHESREYIVEEKSVSGFQKITTSLFSVFSFLFVALNLACVLIFINPKMVFKYIHFGWVIGVVLFVSALSVITGIIFINIIEDSSCKYEDNKQVVKRLFYKNVMLIVFSIIAVLLMIIGLTTTKNKTIEISSREDFGIIDNLPNAANCKYQLTNDIDFENTSPKFWNKLELGEHGFFDGNGYSLKNVNIPTAYGTRADGLGDGYFGMFIVNYGVIKNLKLDNCVITAKSKLLGTLCAANYGTITNCEVENSVITAANSYNVGTLCANNYGTITDCEVLEVYLIADGAELLGGIAGENHIEATIENCKFVNHNYKSEYTSALQGSESYHGIALHLQYSGGKVKNCFYDYDDHCKTYEYKGD